jgi:hypothetical protein
MLGVKTMEGRMAGAIETIEEMPHLDGFMRRFRVGRKIRWQAWRTSHGGMKISPWLPNERAAREWIERDGRHRFVA